MKIYVSKNDEIYLDEIKNKGYRDDVYVYLNNKFYKIFIYEKTRFIQDFETSLDSLGGFVPEPNTIFVEKITNENIIETLKMCNEEDYFEYLKPGELNNNNELNFEYSEKFVLFLKEKNLYERLKIENLLLIYSD